MERHCPIACLNSPGPCQGGGNKKCIQRDPLPSVIVCIIDSYGCTRVVVTHRKNVKYHVRKGELAIITPRLRVHEPIAWGHIAFVVARAELEADKWIEQRGIPNDPEQRECVVMYQLRKKLHKDSRHSLDLTKIAYT